MTAAGDLMTAAGVVVGIKVTSMKLRGIIQCQADLIGRNKSEYYKACYIQFYIVPGNQFGGLW